MRARARQRRRQRRHARRCCPGLRQPCPPRECTNASWPGPGSSCSSLGQHWLPWLGAARPHARSTCAGLRQRWLLRRRPSALWPGCGAGLLRRSCCVRRAPGRRLSSLHKGWGRPGLSRLGVCWYAAACSPSKRRSSLGLRGRSSCSVHSRPTSSLPEARHEVMCIRDASSLRDHPALQEAPSARTCVRRVYSVTYREQGMPGRFVGSFCHWDWARSCSSPWRPRVLPRRWQAP